MKVLILILLIAQPLLATDYVVSLTGNDSNPGTSALPKRTITHAVSLCVPNQDRVILRAGFYTEALSTSITSFPTTVETCELAAWPNESVTIMETDANTIFGIGNKYVRVRNINLQLAPLIAISTMGGPIVPPQALTITLTPTNPAPGATVTITINGGQAVTALDWGALYTIGADDFSHGANWKYLNNSQAPPPAIPSRPATITFPAPPSGTWEVRLFSNDGYTRMGVSASSFTVTTQVPVNPCVTTPRTVTINSVPSSTPGSRRRLEFTSQPSSGQLRKMEFDWGPPIILRITDDRGCVGEGRR